jgi:hypothetical protein
MITQGISQSPYYNTETPSMTTSTPMSTFNTPCRLAMKVVSPKVAPAEHAQSPCKKRRCKKVNFGPDMTLAYIESSSEFTQVEKDDRWYRSSQIESFKKGARNMCRTQLHAKNASIPRHSPTLSVRKGITAVSTHENDTSKDSCRGLEVYYPARQRYCKKYITHVLEAYHVRCVGNDVHVALLAEKWSKKSLHRALIVAKKDFISAYYFQSKEVEYECPLPEEKQKQPLLEASTLMYDPHQQQQQGPKILATSA